MLKYFFIALFTFFVIGCANMQTTKTAEAESTSAGTDTYSNVPQEPAHSYQDFDDILVPKDLTLNRDESIVFKTDQFKTAVLKYSGRVNAEDLFNFYINNMTKDNWFLKFSTKASKSSLIFEKPHKVCRITIDDGTINTKVSMIVVEQTSPNLPASNDDSFKEKDFLQ